LTKIKNCRECQPEQYRGVGFGNLAFQAINNVLSFSFGDASMFGRSVACQKYPQYYRYRWRYSCISYTWRILVDMRLESNKLWCWRYVGLFSVIICTLST